MIDAATTIVVGTADLRRALAATKVHASADPDFSDLHRIRLTVGAENIALSATDRFSAALTVASVWDLDGPPAIVELLPSDVAKVLSIFRAGKETGDEPQYMLRLDIGTDAVTITDCSGMIDGRALRVPRLSTENALNAVPVLFTRALAAQATLLPPDSSVVTGEILARFKPAGALYEAPLSIEVCSTATTSRTTGHALLIRCGEPFLGLMTPRRQLDEDIVTAREFAEGWAARLPGIVAAADDDAAAPF